MHRNHLLALTALLLSSASSSLLAQDSKRDVQVPDDVAFRTADIMSEGTRMAAEVFAPKEPKTDKLPTIIMSHGWGGTARFLRPDAIVFARAGYLVVTLTTAAGATAMRASLPSANRRRKTGNWSPR